MASLALRQVRFLSVQKERKQLVIVGTGWAGYKFLIESKKLRRVFDHPHDVVVISERNVGRLP